MYNQTIEQLKELTNQLINITYPFANDEHIKDSPERVAKYYAEITQFSITKKQMLENDEEFRKLNNIKQDIKVLEELLKLTSFDTENNSEVNSGLYIGPIRVYSLCAHHYAPMFGDVFIGIELKNKMLGLSKYARIAKLYARQPIVQEIYTVNLAKIIANIAKAPVIVASKLRHLCMESRGVQNENSTAIYYHVEGYIQQDLKRIVLDTVCK